MMNEGEGMAGDDPGGPARTGNVGGAVIAQLRGAGVPFVAAVRDVARAQARLGPDLACVPFDFTRPETHAAAFAGVERLFLVRPPETRRRVRRDRPGAPGGAGGGRTPCRLPLDPRRGAQTASWPHHRIEAVLHGSGVAWTFLRASYFMQNLDTVPPRGDPARRIADPRRARRDELRPMCAMWRRSGRWR